MLAQRVNPCNAVAVLATLRVGSLVRVTACFSHESAQGTAELDGKPRSTKSFCPPSANKRSETCL